MLEKSQWIIETTVETFEKDVIQQSMQRPVVVDFWAPWCQPCRQLAPMLEKLAEEANGQFVLVKVNVDESPDISAAFRVQSIPHVVALRNGQLVNQFTGVLPENDLKEWLNQLLPSADAVLIQEGVQLEESDLRGAEAKFREALERNPRADEAKVHLSRVLLNQHRIEDAMALITELETRGFLEPEAERIKSELELRLAASETGGVDAARKAAEADPENLSLKIQLADALAVSNKYEEALQICLSVIEQERTGAGDEAKATMIRIFDMLGNQSELTSIYRRRLSTLLY
ncbi:MAG: thioredoxin [Planctomycetota bacterium]|nr:thioredoxin [Planctomycetota bacterium]MDA1213794.1 thioredoxin [Planctomycetota bacterium]